MKRLFAKNDRYKIVISLGIILIVLVAFLSLRFVENVQKQLWESSITTIVESTHQASDQVSRHIAVEMNNLSEQAQYVAYEKSTNKERLNELIRKLGPAGKPQYLYLAGKHFPEDWPYNPGGYHKVLNSETPAVAEPHLAKVNAQRVIDISVPVQMADGVKGYLLKMIPVQDLADAFSVSFYQGEGYSYLVNLQGEILFRSVSAKGNNTAENLFAMLREDENDNSRKEIELVQSRLNNNELCWSVFRRGQEESVYCFVPIIHTSWYMVSVVPCNVISAQTYAIIKQSMLLAGVMIFGFLWLIGFLIYREKANIRAINEANQEEKDMIILAAMETNMVLLKVDLAKDTFKVILSKRIFQKRFGYDKYCTFSDVIFSSAKSLRPEDREAYVEKFRPDRLRRVLSADHRRESIEVCSLLFEEPHWYQVEAILINNTPEAEQMLCTVKQIDEQKAQEEQRRQAIQSALTVAENANEAKTSFLNNMSHDIRTPMNAIVGMTAIASNNMDDREKVKECLAKITGASNHLLALINDILDMSRIESGKVSLAQKAFSLAALLDNMSSMVMPQAKRKNQQLEILSAGVIHTQVIGDQLRLQQVFLNIISNAVKYTPEGGYIQVELFEEQEQASDLASYKFICRDNGYGMTPEFLEHLFEPFARAEDASKLNIQGTGLGMVIARNIIRMMNGDIKVESVYGAGSCFEVSFQLAKQAEKIEAEAETAADELLTPEAQLAALQQLDYRDKRILLAEDNEINREIAVELFSLTQVQVETAEDGQQAVEHFIMHEPGYYDMIFTDIQMPVMNGHEAARTIRSLPRPDARLIPIVAMTADAFAEDRVNSQRSGMNDHLAKPIDLGKLQEIMVKYMG